MIEIGSLVKWDGLFTRGYDSQFEWIGIVKDKTTNHFGTYWRVVYPNTEQWCLESELETIA